MIRARRPPRERVTGPIWGLDLGRLTGWAHGPPGEIPTSGTWKLKESSAPQDEAFATLIDNTQGAWKEKKPAMVAVEAPLTLAAMFKKNNSEDGVLMAFGLRAIIRGMCWRWNIKFVEVNNATSRKHFIGVGRVGERQLTKDAVVRRAQLLKLVPADCDDEDRCDALCIHDWAAATYGQRAASINELHLFEDNRR